jgi:LEA14-like dessication related protein
MASLSFLDKAKLFIAEKMTNVEKPEADVTDVDLKGVNTTAITYLAKISVTNPYSVSIPIGEIIYNLKSNNRVIASGTVPDPGSIMGNKVTLLEVDLKVPHNVLVTLIKDIGADWDIDYSLELGIIVDLPVIGNFTIPVTSEGSIKLPTLSDLF